ncbi:MAG: guanylate kinase [Proteobacteria bacterium]|nr:MAG: guanylate kinase [Pseudomonadota bacterium]
MTGPSGSGKSTVLERLMARDPRLALSVSHTTRSPRPAEQQGVCYHYVSDEAFAALVEAGGFAEWADVHVHRYGTSHAEIARLRAEGRDIIFDIDVQGGDQLHAAYPDAVRVFVLPPSMAVLEARLRGRGTETAEQLEVRLNNARGEIARAGDYDYIIVNDRLEEAVEDFHAIIQAERRRAERAGPIAQRLLAEGRRDGHGEQQL